MIKSSSLSKKELKIKPGWKLHEKLSKNYTNYLTKIKNKPDVRLFGNYNYYNRPVSYFLEKPNNKITNTNLTPVPKRSINYTKKENSTQEYQKIQKSVITMRRIEYNNKIKSIRTNSNSNISIYYLRLISLIQREWKKRLNLKKQRAIQIQAAFRGFFIYKQFNDVKNLNLSYLKFSYIIRKVLFLNLLKIKKIIKKNITWCYMEKLNFNERSIIFLQRYIIHFFKTKHCKNVYNKQKNVFIKPINNLYLNFIKKIQRNVLIFLERLHSRKRLMKGVFIIKVKRPISQIIFLQRFIRFCLTRKKLTNPISKEGYGRHYFFTKEILVNKPKKFKKEINEKIKVDIPKKQPKKIKWKIKQALSFTTKIHPDTRKILFLQKHILSFLSHRRSTFFFLPILSHDGYIRKINKVVPHKDKLILLQREIKFFLSRQKLTRFVINKVKLEPMKFTKIIQTATEKIFERLSRLRVDYDKDLIVFLVRVIEVMRKSAAKKWFYKLQDKRRELKIKFIKKQNPKKGNSEELLMKDPIELISTENMPKIIKDYKFDSDNEILQQNYLVASTQKDQKNKSIDDNKRAKKDNTNKLNIDDGVNSVRISGKEKDKKDKENKNINNHTIKPINKQDDYKKQPHMIEQKKIISKKKTNDALEKARQDQPQEKPVKNVVKKSEINSTKEPIQNKQYMSRRVLISSIIEKGKRSKSQILLRDEGTFFDIV